MSYRIETRAAGADQIADEEVTMRDFQDRTEAAAFEGALPNDLQIEAVAAWLVAEASGVKCASVRPDRAQLASVGRWLRQGGPAPECKTSSTRCDLTKIPEHLF